MKVIDPGHVYELTWLDGKPDAGTFSLSTGTLSRDDRLIFVKREGAKYPGNVGHHPGTTLQEVLRALISRVKYVHRQQWDFNNTTLLNDLRHAIYLLEERAARKHHRGLELSEEAHIEDLPTCSKCGHIGCEGSCRE